MARRKRPPHRPLSLAGSHWRADGQPKMRFATKRDALIAADHRSKESEADLGVYHCEFCGGWHMGGINARDSD